MLLTFALSLTLASADGGGLEFLALPGPPQALQFGSGTVRPSTPLLPTVVLPADEPHDPVLVWRDDRLPFDTVMMTRATWGTGMSSPVLPLVFERSGSIDALVSAVDPGLTLYLAWEVGLPDGGSAVRACHRPLTSDRVDWCEGLTRFEGARRPRFSTSGGSTLGRIERGKLSLVDLAQPDAGPLPVTGLDVTDFSFIDPARVALVTGGSGVDLVTGPMGTLGVGSQPVIAQLPDAGTRIAYRDSNGTIRDGTNPVLSGYSNPMLPGDWLGAWTRTSVKLISPRDSHLLLLAYPVVDVAAFSTGEDLAVVLEDDVGSNESMLEFQEPAQSGFKALTFDDDTFVHGLAGAEGTAGRLFVWNQGRDVASSNLTDQNVESHRHIGALQMAWSSVGVLTAGLADGEALFALADPDQMSQLWVTSLGRATGVAVAAGASQGVVVWADGDHAWFSYLAELARQRPTTLGPVALAWDPVQQGALLTLYADCVWDRPVCLVALEGARSSTVLFLDANGIAQTLWSDGPRVLGLTHSASAFQVLRQRAMGATEWVPVSFAGSQGLAVQTSVPTQRPFLVAGEPPLLVGEADAGLGRFGGSIVVQRQNACDVAQHTVPLAVADDLRLVGVTGPAGPLSDPSQVPLTLLFEQVGLHEVSVVPMTLRLADATFRCDLDAGTAPDAGSTGDAGLSPDDAGTPDGGSPDAGPGTDAGLPDAGLPKQSPERYAVCGCNAGPSVLGLLALVLLARRRHEHE